MAKTMKTPKRASEVAVNCWDAAGWAMGCRVARLEEAHTYPVGGAVGKGLVEIEAGVVRV